MSWIGTVLREILDLIVDDLGFALAILGWLAIVALVFPPLGVPSALNGVALFVGLALILLESAMRQAGR